MPQKSVIFDLDGTLIDSEESILKALLSTLKIYGMNPVVPLSRNLIGPPLFEVLQKISGVSSKKTLDELALTFIDLYDNGGYCECIAFEGVNSLLASLMNSGINLYVATNKRLLPTLKILNFFQWTQYFKAVYAIDSSPTGRYENKTDTIASLIFSYSICKEYSIYVGDRIDDFKAAKLNGIDSILVGWGYGNFPKTNQSHLKVAYSMLELEKKLMNFLR